MRRTILAGAVAALVAGCGGDSKFAPRDYSDEEKKKIQAEDKQVENEESQGTAGKKKAGKK